MRNVLVISAAALALAACGGGNDRAEGERTAGPVVSGSEEPRNEAIDTSPTAPGTAQTPGASSFTEAQARGAIESAGYANVGALTQNEQGLWQGPATKNGAQVTVSVDYRGSVTER
ncbi:MAG: hypothetical protein ACK41C_19310 [Phenylobacterium sp.]|uniref:hypothetical protein n=1 Tax=Phenylobacterium sp. TaxID=1871053 RepID=UPI00391D3E90